MLTEIIFEISPLFNFKKNKIIYYKQQKNSSLSKSDEKLSNIEKLFNYVNNELAYKIFDGFSYNF